MKRIAALLAIVSSFVITAPAYAMSLCPSGSNFGNLCNIKPQNVGGVVGAVIQVLLIIAIIVSLFFLIWGGIRWITSGGDKGGVQAARSMIIAAIVGLIISLLAYFIVDVILYFMTGKGLTSLQIPTLL
jgi:hypothetical protein